MTSAAVALSPELIRDGDAAALQELVRRRGTAVVAYARVFGEEIVDDAVTETFARFRAAVHAQNELVTHQPDQLLLSCTRNSVSSMIAHRRPYPCTSTVPLMVAGAEQDLGEEAAARLEAHVSGCDRCREDRSRFAQAERAYRNGRVADVVPAIAERAVAAMLAAAPVPGASVVLLFEDEPEIEREEALLEALRDDEPFVDDEPLAVAEPVSADVQELAQDDRSRSTALHRVTIPAGIITVAAIGAAAIAGVFGGTAPAPPGGVPGPPGPQPPAQRPPADEATQRRAADSARAALARIEVTDRRTTAEAAIERLAEQRRERARENTEEDPSGTSDATPTTGTRTPESGNRVAPGNSNGTRSQDEVESVPDDDAGGSGTESGSAPQFEVSPAPAPTATP